MKKNSFLITIIALAVLAACQKQPNLNDLIIIDIKHPKAGDTLGSLDSIHTHTFISHIEGGTIHRRKMILKNTVNNEIIFMDDKHIDHKGNKKYLLHRKALYDPLIRADSGAIVPINMQVIVLDHGEGIVMQSRDFFIKKNSSKTTQGNTNSGHNENSGGHNH